MRKLLRVTSPWFVAGAVWQVNQDTFRWECVRAGALIRWMERRDPRFVKAYLEHKRFKWVWLDVEFDKRAQGQLELGDKQGFVS